jgi:hypothetical protein
MLLRAKADPNRADASGNTPLHALVDAFGCARSKRSHAFHGCELGRYNALRAAKLLRIANASVSVANVHGCTVLDLLVNYTAVARTLRVSAAGAVRMGQRVRGSARSLRLKGGAVTSSEAASANSPVSRTAVALRVAVRRRTSDTLELRSARISSYR